MRGPLPYPNSLRWDLEFESRVYEVRVRDLGAVRFPDLLPPVRLAVQLLRDLARRIAGLGRVSVTERRRSRRRCRRGRRFCGAGGRWVARRATKDATGPEWTHA